MNNTQITLHHKRRQYKKNGWENYIKSMMIIIQKQLVVTKKNMVDQNPRATQIHSRSCDEEEIYQVLTTLQGLEQVNVFIILQKYLQYPQIKNQPQFCQILFNEHINIIVDLIELMLIPKMIIKKKKNTNNNLKYHINNYSYYSKQFMKDNWCFYQEIYIAARNKKIQFSIWFLFLKKQFFDKDTFYTALGYFVDVMIPFAKYQFCMSFNLSKSLEISLQNSKNLQTLSIMKILPQSLIDQLIKYCHYDGIYLFLKTAILVSIQDPRDYHISKSALLKMLKGAQMSNIFSRFPILTSQSNDLVAKSMDYLQSVANGVKQLTQNIQLNTEAVFRSTAMISVVVQSNIIRYAVDQLVQSRLCGLMGRQKQSYKLHSSASNIIKSNPSIPDSSQNSLSFSTNSNLSGTSNISFNPNISAYNLSPLPQIGSFTPLVDADQQQLAQTLFKILSGMVEVFVRIPRNLNVSDGSDDQNKQYESQNNQVVNSNYKNNNQLMKSLKQKPKQFTYQQYSSMTSQFRQQMQYILNNMQILTKFVYNQTQNGIGSSFSKIIPFASGQNVKAISFMKYQFFKLIHNVLIMIQCKDSDHLHFSVGFYQACILENKDSKDKDNQKKDWKQSRELKQTLNSTKQDNQQNNHEKQDFELEKQLKQPPNLQKIISIQSTKQKRKSIQKLKSITIQPIQPKIQKLQLIQIIKKYLNDNRWNNIAHHLLQKITHLLIMCRYDYIKKNIQKDKNKKFSDSFLAFLIENFVKRDFVFLNTVKFTTQGNLHSLYNIAKDLAYTLNSTNQLVLFLNQFQPWKKFIMTDLRNYQEKTFPNATRPQDYDTNQDGFSSNLKVDQADSIKKLIEKISTTKKWPSRTKSKRLSKSGVFEYRKTEQGLSRTEVKDNILTKSRLTIQQKQKYKQPQQYALQGLQQILKKQIEDSNKGSQVRQFDIEEISVRDKLMQNKKEIKMGVMSDIKVGFAYERNQYSDKKY